MFFLSSSYKLPWNLKKAPWIKGNHQFLGVPILVFQSGLTLVAFSSQVVSWVQEVQRTWTKLLIELVSTMSSWNVESTFCFFSTKNELHNFGSPMSWGLWVEYPKFPFFIDRITMGGIPEKKNWRKPLKKIQSTVMIMSLSMIMVPPKKWSWQSRRTPETNSSCPRPIFRGSVVPVLLHFREDPISFKMGGPLAVIHRVILPKKWPL